MIYIVIYDLLEPGQRYEDLVARIKEYGNWARLGYSCFLIDTEETPVQIRDSLKPAIDKNDRLYVGVVNAPAAWFGLPENVSEWIKNRL